MPLSALSAYDQLILAEPGLVRYYPLDDALGSTTAHDLKAAQSGTTNLQTYSQPSIVPADPSPGAAFTGHGMVIPYTGLPTGANPWTYELWVYPTTLNTYVLGSWGGGSAGQAPDLFYTSTGGGSFGMLSFDGSIPAGTFVVNRRHHVVLTMASNLATLFVNDVQIGTVSVTAAIPTSGSADLGAYGGGGFDLNNAVMQKAAIYNVALTPTQVAQHYQMGLLGGVALPFVTPAWQTWPVLAVQASGTVNINVSDSLSLSDGVSVAVSVPVADTLSLTDAQTIAASLTVADVLALVDSRSIAVTVPTIADALTLTDAVSVGVPINVSDSLALADALAVAVAVPVSDSLALVDALSIAVALSLSDTLSVADAPAILASFTLADVLALTDGVSVGLFGGVSPTPHGLGTHDRAGELLATTAARATLTGSGTVDRAGELTGTTAPEGG